MNVDIESIFKATARSVWHFLVENGQGCYIPAYQRQYAWDKGDISRLFEDVLHGIQQIANRPETISFLGTLIAIHDTKYETVEPLYQNEVAPRVMTIIDGQQRICTAIMSNIVLHNYIWRSSFKFQRKEEKQFTWICDQSTEILADLRNTCLIDRNSGDGNYRYYPRVIRAHIDTWSRRESQAKYESPMAKLIWEYIDFAASGKRSKFAFNPKDAEGKPIELHKALVAAFRVVQRQLQHICKSESEMIDLVTATQDPSFSKAIWGFETPQEVSKYIAEQSSDDDYPSFCELFRLLVFARYLNRRVAITVVTATNEDDAFDMFEALNTTGAPLTAFETFKPKVIDLETLPRYKRSPSYQYVADVEGYLDRYTKADDKQSATSEMLVPFALAETGRKLQKKLNDQRRYLRDEFEKLSRLGNIEKNRAFVRSIARVAKFMEHGWNPRSGESPTFMPLTIDDEEALIGFDALRALKHSITIAPLSRFYQYCLETKEEEERAQRTAELAEAIKATVAFSFLWRGAKGGTANIDSHYRDIMRIGIQTEGANIPPLAHRPKGKSGALSLPNYKKALQAIFRDRGNLPSKDEWVKSVTSTPVYQHSHVLARFLLFCATDDAIPDPSDQGLIQPGRRGVAPMLTPMRWREDAYFSVEHIAPNSKNSAWTSEIYEHPDSVHTLGNLILLPLEANKVVSDKKWEHKRLMYRLLSSDSEPEFESLKQELDSHGLVLSEKAADVLDNSRYLNICKSIAQVDGQWSLDLIQRRTRRLAELAWDRLAPWLWSES